MGLLPDNATHIHLSEIILSTSQARQRDTKVEEDDDLVQSIRKDGLHSPVVLKKINEGKYELLSGQRRFRAHQILRKPTIKAYVIEKNIDEFEAKKLSFIENAARKDMKRADYVDTIQVFMNKYNNTKTVAEELGMSVSTIRKYLTIGRLPEKVQVQLQEKKITGDSAIKALDALGGDETNVDSEVLLETAQEIQKLSLPAKKKMVKIMKHKLGESPIKAAEEAQRTTKLNKFTIEVTDDLLTKIDEFKETNEINKTEDAVIELIDRGLDSTEA